MKKLAAGELLFAPCLKDLEDKEAQEARDFEEKAARIV